jgi:hypothetical protein
LTKLMNAERIKRVRSGSGAARSRELKSMMRAEVAKRVLVVFFQVSEYMQEEVDHTGGRA